MTEIASNLDDIRIGERINELSKDGYSYPKARLIAYEELFGDSSNEILSRPNDTLHLSISKQMQPLRTQILFFIL